MKYPPAKGHKAPANLTNAFNIVFMNSEGKVKTNFRCFIGSEYVTLSFLKKLDERNNTIFVYQLTILYTFFINS